MRFVRDMCEYEFGARVTRKCLYSKWKGCCKVERKKSFSLFWKLFCPQYKTLSDKEIREVYMYSARSVTGSKT